MCRCVPNVLNNNNFITSIRSSKQIELCLNHVIKVTSNWTIHLNFANMFQILCSTDKVGLFNQINICFIPVVQQTKIWMIPLNKCREILSFLNVVFNRHTFVTLDASMECALLTWSKSAIQHTSIWNILQSVFANFMECALLCSTDIKIWRLLIKLLSNLAIKRCVHVRFYQNRNNTMCYFLSTC